MFTISTTAEPSWKTLIPAGDDRPAVEVLFPHQPPPKALRCAREAIAKVLAGGGDIETAADAFTCEILRHSILDWRGIGNDAEEPVPPTPDRPILDEKGTQTGIERGTISAFLAEPRLVEAADREFVTPWVDLDAEKNGYALSPNGISAGATQDEDIAGSSAMPTEQGDATPTKAAPAAPTAKKSRGRKRATSPGK